MLAVAAAALLHPRPEAFPAAALAVLAVFVVNVPPDPPESGGTANVAVGPATPRALRRAARLPGRALWLRKSP